MTLLSIVTVSRNDVAGLQRTAHSLRSLLDSGGSDVEWVVWDGGSTDGSGTWLASSPAATWRSDPDAGIYDAMNRATALACGEHVMYLNAGDELLLEDVAELRAKLQADVILGGGYELVLGNDRRLSRACRSWDYLGYSLPTSHQAIVYPRPWIAREPYDPSFRIAGDYDLTCRLVRRGALVATTEARLARFYRGGTSSRHPWRLAREAAEVQRTTLEASYPVIAASAARRIATGYAARILDHVGAWRATQEVPA